MNGRSRSGVALAVVVLLGLLVAPGLSSSKGLASVVWKPLKAPGPSWYTPELRSQVIAAGAHGVAIPKGVDVPTSSLVFLGIRPGQLIILTHGNVTSLCTSNFVFKNGPDFFIGTAGHCGAVGDQVTMLYLPAGLVDIGNVVKSTGDAGIGNDFALISIHPNLYPDVSPSLAYWGGPTGVYTGSGPAVVMHAGWGVVIGTGGTPRVGIGTSFTPNEWRFIGAITPGDSGSGARVSGGEAAGNITHISVGTGNLLADAAGTSMSKILQILGGGYQLATCSAIPWPLTGCP